MICFCLYLCRMFWGNKCFHSFIHSFSVSCCTTTSGRKNCVIPCYARAIPERFLEISHNKAQYKFIFFTLLFTVICVKIKFHWNRPTLMLVAHYNIFGVFFWLMTDATLIAFYCLLFLFFFYYSIMTNHVCRVKSFCHCSNRQSELQHWILVMSIQNKSATLSVVNGNLSWLITFCINE